MNIGRTANPALNSKIFRNVTVESNELMTVNGTINKTFVLFGLLLFGAYWPWQAFYTQGPTASMMGYILIGALGGFGVAIFTAFKPSAAPISAPIYAFLEGLFIGAISAIFEKQYPNIVIQAASLTFLTLFSLLAAYRSGLIKVTEKFRMGVVAATGAIFLIYVVNIFLSLLTPISIPFIHSSGPMGILFSLFVVGIAALNLVLDFDLIENFTRNGAPRFMEWYGAFALMVTLVWLYIEMLRLLSKLRSR